MKLKLIKPPPQKTRAFTKKMERALAKRLVRYEAWVSRFDPERKIPPASVWKVIKKFIIDHEKNEYFDLHRNISRRQSNSIISTIKYKKELAAAKRARRKTNKQLKKKKRK